MKSFSLLHCYPARNGQSGNFAIFDCKAGTKPEAIEKLKSASGLELNEDGYLKAGEITFCVAEAFDPFSTATSIP